MLDDKIQEFNKNNPQVNDKELEDLIKEVAKTCMQAIVNNVELNGRASGGWYTIREAFDIEVEEQSLLLPLSREQDAQLIKKFEEACYNTDIETIKECLNKYVRINHNEYKSALTEAITVGDLKVLKFFIEDPFINNNLLQKSQVSFETQKEELFNIAYYYKRKEIIEYFILEHNLELLPKVKEELKKTKKDLDEENFRQEILFLIENKYLNYMLEMRLENKEEKRNKPKI